jgi:O-antigen/teichoic acid export membrane protein
MKRIKKIFFNNINQKQIIFKNTFWLAVAEVVIRLFKFFLIIYVVRVLGATEYGKFSFAFSFVALLTIFFDCGLSSIVTREFAKDKKQEKYFPSIISLKFFLSIFAFALIVGGSFFITTDQTIRRTIFILASYSFLAEFSTLFFAFFRARQKMEYEAWFKIIQGLILIGIAFTIMTTIPSVAGLSYAYLLSSAVGLIIILPLFNKVFPLKIGFNKCAWKRFFLMAWPLALIGGLATIYNSVDSVMMGYWGQITETGYYNAVYKIIGVILLPGGLLIQGFYPALSSQLKHTKKRQQKTWNFKMQIMIFLALPLLIGGTIVASRLIQSLYGPEFYPGVLSFQILLWSVIAIYLYTPHAQALIVFNRQKKLFWIVLFGAILNMTLNFLLIPKYSLNGAATATVITHIFLLILLFILVPKFTPIRLINWSVAKIFTFSLIASIIMGITISYLGLGLIASILAGAGIYFFVFATLNLKIVIAKLKTYAIKG